MEVFMTIAATAEQIAPLSVGTNVPEGALITMDGQKTSLKEVLNNKPAVVIFYRGDW